MKRPYSTFLCDLIYNTPECELNLGGSTPVFPFEDDYFDSIKFQMGVPRLIPDYQKLLSETAKRLRVNEDQVLFTPGSSQALLQVLSAITEPGDSILIENPNYEPFVSQSQFLGLDVSLFQRTGNEVVDEESIRQANKSKVLLLSNAHAPLGNVYSKNFILGLCQKFEWVIVDEDFYPLFTDGQMTGIEGLEAPENLITLHSFNKALGLLFIRMGYIRANSKVILESDMMGTLFHIDVPAPSYQVGAYAMERWEEIIEQIFKNLEQPRQQFLQLVSRSPEKFTHDFSSGFYNFMKVPEKYVDGEAFSEALLKQTGIYVRPGRLFGLPQHIRLHIFLSEGQTKKLLKAFEDLS